MKKYFILLQVLFCAINGNSQLTDTLLFLRSHIENKRGYFSGRPLHILLDSLYNLKTGITEYSSPADVNQFSDEKRPGTAANKDTLFINEIRCYFGQISGGNRVAALHEKNAWNNFDHKKHDTINTHVPFIKIVFTKPVPFLKTWCRDGLCNSDWNPFAEKYFGSFLINNVSVGEY